MVAPRSLTVASAAAAALAVRYAAGRRRVEGQTVRELDTRLANLGVVDRLSVMPLVERHTVEGALRGEPGVSYLIRADALTLLFDTGLGSGTGRTALESNAHALGAQLDDIDCIVISHLHADHVRARDARAALAAPRWRAARR